MPCTLNKKNTCKDCKKCVPSKIFIGPRGKRGRRGKNGIDGPPGPVGPPMLTNTDIFLQQETNNSMVQALPQDPCNNQVIEAFGTISLNESGVITIFPGHSGNFEVSSGLIPSGLLQKLCVTLKDFNNSGNPIFLHENPVVTVSVLKGTESVTTPGEVILALPVAINTETSNAGIDGTQLIFSFDPFDVSGLPSEIIQISFSAFGCVTQN